MDNKGVAHQRKNHVLSESSKRLKNLLKGDHGNEAEEELKHPATPPNQRRTSPRSLSPRKTDKAEKTKKADPKEEVVTEGDPSTVRFVGYLQLHLFVLAFVLGAFVCYYRHHQHSTGYYPRFLMNVFALLKKKGVHNLVDKGFHLWNSIPEEKRKKVVKYLGYGTVFLNLYPVLTAPPKKKDQEDEVVVEVDPQREFQNKLNKHVVKVGSSFFRLLSATVLCGLLGYDLAYNLHYVKAFLARLLRR